MLTDYVATRWYRAPRDPAGVPPLHLWCRYVVRRCAPSPMHYNAEPNHGPVSGLPLRTEASSKPVLAVAGHTLCTLSVASQWYAGRAQPSSMESV